MNVHQYINIKAHICGCRVNDRHIVPLAKTVPLEDLATSEKNTRNAWAIPECYFNVTKAKWTCVIDSSAYHRRLRLFKAPLEVTL